MKNNIKKSMKTKLYKKTAEKIEEMRQEIAASIFEFYKGSHDTGEAEGEVSDEPSDKEKDEVHREDCLNRLKKKYPNKDTSFYNQKIEDGECKKLDEAKKPTTKKPVKKPVKKPTQKSAPEMAPVRPQARQSALDIMARAMLGLGSLGEQKIPSAVLARRKAGGMKNAESKPLGFKGKHPGKG
jgi:murein L,D-transpeptidase YafK